ncbi:MAG: cysteine desulfurase [Bacteroidaceae bacterium]|nr:cysteine desulfurase [Bacteroidaceae bacterium]
MDIEKIRQDFPILGQTVYNKPLVYLDNAATTQKPRVVVDSMQELYYTVNANVHRGVHYLSARATEMLEQARERVASFIGSESAQNIIFTRGTTESLNLIASSFTKAFVKPGSQIIVSAMEHHSNIVPWQLEAVRAGAELKVIPVDENGNLLLDEYKKLFTDKTVLVSVTHVSNVLGTVNPVAELAQIAHSHNVPIVIDGAQSTPHMKIDVRAIDADFFVFSGHKMYGPTGIGVLYGKRELLEAMPPYQGGGEMIKHVSFEKTTYNELPYKFEAGTPDYIAAIALARAIDYMDGIGIDAIEQHERELMQYAMQRLSAIKDIRFIGNAAHRSGVISFLVGNIHPTDMGVLLDRLGIAVRTGHHCAEPLMNRYGIPGTLRISFGLYNTIQEIDSLIAALDRVIPMLS